MAIDLIAPAKLNLTLEILGRRPDGYHEIASVMVALDLVDRVRLEPADTLVLELTGDALLGVPREGPRNLAFGAAQALREEARRPDLGARIILEKQIPAGMGLGGGSADAGAVLRGLNRLWRLDLGLEALSRVAASVGSDVTFFLHGGAAVARGRGELIAPLPELAPLDFTLFVSDIETEDKTRRMYAALRTADFSDGNRTRVTAETLRQGLPLTEQDIVNAFDRHAAAVAPPMSEAMAACRAAGIAVFACGSGPGFFSLTPQSELPALLSRQLEREWDVHVLACRSLTRAAALTLRED